MQKAKQQKDTNPFAHTAKEVVDGFLLEMNDDKSLDKDTVDAITNLAKTGKLKHQSLLKKLYDLRSKK